MLSRSASTGRRSGGVGAMISMAVAAYGNEPAAADDELTVMAGGELAATRVDAAWYGGPVVGGARFPTWPPSRAGLMEHSGSAIQLSMSSAAGRKSSEPSSCGPFWQRRRWRR